MNIKAGTREMPSLDPVSYGLTLLFLMKFPHLLMVNERFLLVLCTLIPNFMTGEERRVIFQAMYHWEENTCIRFRPRTSSDRNYVHIVTSVAGE